jgi:hypothetical protein
MDQRVRAIEAGFDAAEITDAENQTGPLSGPDLSE